MYTSQVILIAVSAEEPLSGPSAAFLVERKLHAAHGVVQIANNIRNSRGRNVPEKSSMTLLIAVGIAAAGAPSGILV